MSISFAATAPTSPAGLVVGARERLTDLHETLWAARSPREKLDVVAEVERLKSELAALEADVIADLDITRSAAQDGWASAADFVTAMSGGYRGSGGSEVRLARALTGECKLTHAALRAAEISKEQARVIVRVIGELPMKPGLRERAEKVMLANAETMGASDLKDAGRLLLEVVDPDGSERKAEKKLAREERAAHHNRFLSISEDGVGGVRIKGRTTVEDAGIIKAALFPLAAPAPAQPGADDDPARCEDGRDPRDHGARLLDALVEGCRRLMGADVLPEAHGATPRLSLTMDLGELQKLTGLATLETGELVSASAVRRLACDADVTAIVLGSHSEILDVARTRRLVTAAIWKALVVRDRHCAFPGCRRAPIACDAHHIEHWLDGGGTGLDNLVLLCRAHHMMMHNTPWQVRLNPVDRKPEFIPPFRLDPDQKPMRERRPRE
ncbi:MAG TPA: DUF222 domain-containing protein [Nocardioidaceae bacterium]|nr:DUF222 domain-containing protein [Nocardioidaceae bacterium]